MSCFPYPNHCQAMAHHYVLEQQDLFLKAWVYRAGEEGRKEERGWGSPSSWMMRSLLFFSHYKIRGRHCCSLPTPEMFVTKPLPSLKWLETVTSLFWNSYPILFSKPPPGCSRLAFPRSTHFPAGPAVCQKGNCGEGEGALSRGMVRHFEINAKPIFPGFWLSPSMKGKQRSGHHDQCYWSHWSSFKTSVWMELTTWPHFSGKLTWNSPHGPSSYRITWQVSLILGPEEWEPGFWVCALLSFSFPCCYRCFSHANPKVKDDAENPSSFWKCWEKN